MLGDVFHVVIMQQARRKLAVSFAAYSAKLTRSLFGSALRRSDESVDRRPISVYDFIGAYQSRNSVPQETPLRLYLHRGDSSRFVRGAPLCIPGPRNRRANQPWSLPVGGRTGNRPKSFGNCLPHSQGNSLLDDCARASRSDGQHSDAHRCCSSTGTPNSGAPVTR